MECGNKVGNDNISKITSVVIGVDSKTDIEKPPRTFLVLGGPFYEDESCLVF